MELNKYEPKVFIIIVNYNGYKDTVECVKSILNITYKNYEIILIENGSGDKNKISNNEFLLENTTIIYSDVNLGFSGGNNIGIEYSKKENADFVLLLNNDTVVERNFLTNLVDVALESKASITTGDIAFYTEPSKLWYSNGAYDYYSGKTKMVNCEKDKYRYKEVSFATGCLMLIKMEYIIDYGLLDENYFLYSEDTDYCCRATENQKKIVWTPFSKIYHKISSSTEENSAFQQYYLIRNDLYIIKKYSRNKIRAYFTRYIYWIKQVLKHKYNLIPLYDASKDFINNKMGRTKKY